MAKYLRVIKGILTQFDEWYAEHVPREENTTEDALSQLASSEIEKYPRSIYFQVLKTPTVHANGQAEVANRIILDGLKNRVERSRNTWVDELLPILWAYHTTYKVITEATPFMLTYRAEVVVPLEITHGSPRIEAYEPETNNEGMRLTLDLIDEVRDETNARNAEHQQRASLYCNRRVKERIFQQGDFVLRKIEASGVRERGKLALNWEGPYKVQKTLGWGFYKLETMNGDEVPCTWHASNLNVHYV
ncbi:uncharacterized protein LOC141690405 [Apium graveolens]|uniref:uncharacterized protein LOC141690405 n=1 Tax=Apium graveolens TaxID=4045 RepID=UPI003D7A7192